MLRISLLISFIFIISCSFNRLKPNENQKHNIEIDVISYKIQESDSFNVNILLIVPLKLFVFNKQKDHFEANINYTISFIDTLTNEVVKRISENKSMTVSYYEDTRDNDRYFQIETQVQLTSGAYYLLSIVEDSDSHRIYKTTEVFEVGQEPPVSKIIAFYYENNQRIYIKKVIKEDVDSIWFKFQIDAIEFIDDNVPIIYRVLMDTTLIDSNIVNIPENKNNIYIIPIKIAPEWDGEITIFMGISENFSSIKLNIENKDGTKLWSTKRNDIVGIMAYLLPYSEIKKYTELDDDELFEQVVEYWNAKDPTVDTKRNELLEEINNRISYANAQLSVLGKGWKSDMGKIYIIYGPPESSDRHYNAEFSYSYEIWYYSSGRKFIFSDRRNFGELKLVNEF